LAGFAVHVSGGGGVTPAPDPEIGVCSLEERAIDGRIRVEVVRVDVAVGGQLDTF